MVRFQLLQSLKIIFVGLMSNKPYMAIKSHSITDLILTKSLNKLETSVEEETISFSSLKRLPTCLSDWDQGKYSWNYEEKDGNIEFNVCDMEIGLWKMKIRPR